MPTRVPDSYVGMCATPEIGLRLTRIGLYHDSMKMPEELDVWRAYTSVAGGVILWMGYDGRALQEAKLSEKQALLCAGIRISLGANVAGLDHLCRTAGRRASACDLGHRIENHDRHDCRHAVEAGAVSRFAVIDIVKFGDHVCLVGECIRQAEAVWTGPRLRWPRAHCRSHPRFPKRVRYVFERLLGSRSQDNGPSPRFATIAERP